MPSSSAPTATANAGKALTASSASAASTLWDINHEKQDDRIRARRKRISNRLEAAKKLAALLKCVLGASINEVHKISEFFEPLHPIRIEFTQPPLLCPIFHDPLPL